MKTRSFICIIFLIFCHITFPEAFTQQISKTQQDQVLFKSSIRVVPGSKGDVDGNGAIEIFDLIRTRDISIGRLSNPVQSQFFAGDVNSDGFIRKDDVEKIRDILLQKSIPPPTIFNISPSSGSVGDQISINVQHFDATTSNTRIKFPGNNPEVAPDRVDGAFGVPDVTNVLVTKIPDNLEEGIVKIFINVDNNERIEFEGGKIELFQTTDYAGTLTFDEWTTTYAGQSFDFLPPPESRTVPIRFTLNKTYEEEFFFAGLQPAGSSTFLVESNVISYSR